MYQVVLGLFTWIRFWLCNFSSVPFNQWKVQRLNHWWRRASLLSSLLLQLLWFLGTEPLHWPLKLLLNAEKAEMIANWRSIHPDYVLSAPSIRYLFILFYFYFDSIFFSFHLIIFAVADGPASPFRFWHRWQQLLSISTPRHWLSHYQTDRLFLSLCFSLLLFSLFCALVLFHVISICQCCIKIHRLAYNRSSRSHE